MRTDRSCHPRTFVLLLVAGCTVPVLAQASAPAPIGEPLFEVSNMLNYAMLALAAVQTVFILSMTGIMRTMGGSRAWAKRFAEQKGRAWLTVPLVLLLSTQASAQAYQGEGSTMNNYDIFWLLLGVNVILFIILLVQINITRKMVSIIAAKREAAVDAAQAKAPSWVDNLMKRLTRQVEIEKEQDVLMHHEYDGIRELDNVLPPWWVWLFYGSIIWSVVYLVNVHVIDIWPDQKTEYTDEMAQAKVDVDAYLATLTNTVDESTVTVITDPGELAKGAALFAQFCTPCHGADGAGSETSVGPNLTDAYWINGGGVQNVFKTIKYGVAEKGMISWKSQLQPAEMAALASYILGLQGTGTATQKAPQGELWTDAPTPADSTGTLPDSTTVLPDTALAVTN